MAVFRGTSRFRLVRLIGRGGMGVVYEAFDEVNAAPVALKVLPVVSPDLLLRFKREFRMIADVRHPNLVRLGELTLEGAHWFFTMELVRGMDLVRYVRGLPDLRADSTTPPAPPKVAGVDGSPTLPLEARRNQQSAEPSLADHARLRPALAQLARALLALHAAGFVHRDVKPSNVVVTMEGHVVLLDFGLVSAAQGESTLFVDAGTPEYMAPEQVARAQVTAAADWYAFGTILFELLAGRLPFDGLRHEIQYRKQHDEPPRVETIAPDAPADLAALCNALLSRDPERRPDGLAVLAALAPGTPAPIPDTSSSRGDSTVHFVGRHAELDELERAFAAVRSGDGGRALVVRGESGVGKSTLIRSFLDRLGPADAVVLAARCYERELLPFKAVDGLVDALTQVLRKRESSLLESRLPPAASILLQAFPVLGRIDVIARASHEQVNVDLREVRGSMFAALRALLAITAEVSPIVAFIDDLQWADADSLVLLSEVLRPPNAPRILLLGTLRTTRAGVEANGPLLGDGIPEQQLFLENLGADAARALARDLLRERGDPDPAGGAELLADESAGHPLFLLELARTLHRRSPEGSHLTLDGVLRAKIGAFSEPAVRVLQVLAIAGAPTSLRTLRRAADLDGSTTVRLLDELRAAKVIQSIGDSSDDVIDITHDRIRQVARDSASGAKIKELHESLAASFEDAGEPLRAAGHWREAGNQDRAAIHFATAARLASGALAFDRAAEHFEAALALKSWPADSRRELLIGLADALSNAGRGGMAAPHYQAAAESAGPAMALDLRRRGAEELIRSGRLDEGRDLAARALADAGLRFANSPVQALLRQRAVLWLRGLGFRRRAAEEIAPSDLARIDLCWSLSSGLCLMDPVQGAHFQARSLLLALRAGEPHRIMRGIAGEAAYVAAQGNGGRARQLLAGADRMAAELKEPHAAGIVALASGLSHHLLGEFEVGLLHLRNAAQIFRERCVGTIWELNAVRHFTLECLYYVGDLPSFASSAAEGLKEANDRGSVYAATTLRTGLANAVWLLQDDPERARDQVAAAMRDWSPRGYHIQHWYELMAQTQIDLYLGDGDAAHARVERGWSRLRGSHLLRMRHTRIVAVHLRGRAALAAAEHASPALRRRMIRLARSCAVRLWRDGNGWSRPLASLIHAGAEHLEGNSERSAHWLRLAIEESSARGLSLFAAAARMQAREICGDGETGATGERWMVERRVRAPAKLARLLFPGVRFCPPNSRDLPPRSLQSPLVVS